ncbi:MAG TPA: DUF362 domain-containing protein [Candidatus Limnocylindrales bacterium]|nr:DUF362 domain-containing protein [Candidatus Limnocylindrales bacterium]
MNRVVIARSDGNLVGAVKHIFERCGGLDCLLKGRTRVWIKINAIDCRPETYTSPAVLETVIEVLKNYGIKNITVVENCTQGNFTRLVFAATELGPVCRRQGVRTLFLDEGPVEECELPGLSQKARFPRVIIDELCRDKREVFFLNLPRMKTHSMSVLTLGIKNLLGLMDQRDRMHDHNDMLHGRLASLGELFRPDFTIIDGIRAVYHGHYPPASVVDRCLAPLEILVGGADMLAVDVIGARILGYHVSEVPHLALAAAHSDGCTDLETIEVDGDLSIYETKYPCTMLPDMPPDVQIIRGSERCCPEGCRFNTEAVLQFLYLDHQGKGGFCIVMGKGFEPAALQEIYGPVLLAGKCAIEETGDFFTSRLGPRQVYRSPACNDLASTVKALTKLMKVNPLKLVPINPIRSLGLLAVARLKGSKARVAL